MFAFSTCHVVLDQDSCKGRDDCFKSVSRSFVKDRDCYSFSILSNCSASDGDTTRMFSLFDIKAPSTCERMWTNVPKRSTTVMPNPHVCINTPVDYQKKKRIHLFIYILEIYLIAIKMFSMTATIVTSLVVDTLALCLVVCRHFVTDVINRH